jgi:hypothetical protein
MAARRGAARPGARLQVFQLHDALALQMQHLVELRHAGVPASSITEQGAPAAGGEKRRQRGPIQQNQAPPRRPRALAHGKREARVTHIPWSRHRRFSEAGVMAQPSTAGGALWRMLPTEPPHDDLEGEEAEMPAPTCGAAPPGAAHDVMGGDGAHKLLLASPSRANAAALAARPGWFNALRLLSSLARWL